MPARGTRRVWHILMKPNNTSAVKVASSNPASLTSSVTPERSESIAASLTHLGETSSSTANSILASLACPASQPDPILPGHPLTIESLRSLRVSNIVENDGVPLPRVAKICKPSKQTWFRTNPEIEWELYLTFSPEGETDQTIYFVSPNVAHVLGSLATLKRLVPCITLEGVIFFWPLSVSDRPNGYNDSARLIASEAVTDWRRMASDFRAKVYQAFAPRFRKPDPVWPDAEQLQQLLLKALEGRIIDSEAHPAIAKLL